MTSFNLLEELPHLGGWCSIYWSISSMVEFILREACDNSNRAFYETTTKPWGLIFMYEFF